MSHGIDPVRTSATNPAPYSDKSRRVGQPAYETILDLKEVLAAYRDPSRARHIYNGKLCRLVYNKTARTVEDHRCVWCQKADKLLGLENDRETA